ncbi:MAG: TerD family protein [Candidatus Competibacteraceae bacterium]|nr:TerD family protein [Candidatus Competibacteraceae bacterium]
MTQALPKGGNAAIAQADPTARALFVGLSWEAPPAMSSVVIDASVFLLNADGVVRDDSDFVFYNQEADISGAVYRLPTDELDRTQDQDGFVVVLSALSEDVRRLAFCLTLDTASTSNATFGALSWVQARLVNHDSGQEFLRYRDNDDVDQKTALIVAELYRHPNGWKFKAVGQGFAGGLQALAAHFGVLVADEDSPSANAAVTEEALTASALMLEKEATGSEATGKRRRRRTLQDVLTAQVEEIKTRYRAIQPLLKRVMQDSPNESQSRLLLDRILQDVLGYSLGEIKTEQKIQGRAADYVLAPGGVDALVIEAKRIGAPLRDKQIFQATSYAAYAGIRWALLTNVVNWQLYRVATENKVEADLVFALDLQGGLDGDSAYRLMLLSKTGITRCELLDKLWRKKVALSQESLIAAILNEEVLNKIRAVLLRERGYPLTNQEIQDAIEREVLR